MPGTGLVAGNWRIRRKWDLCGLWPLGIQAYLRDGQDNRQSEDSVIIAPLGKFDRGGFQGEWGWLLQWKISELSPGEGPQLSRLGEEERVVWVERSVFGQAPKGEMAREMAGTQCTNSWLVLLCGPAGRVHGVQSSSLWTRKPLSPGCGRCIRGLKYS